MSKIGNKISYFRNLKGFSQEALADKSGLNIRTIQRIEKGETDPRGDSIQRLCNALETSPEEIVEWQQVEDRGYLTALHLSALSFLIFPLLGIIVPLILWIYKKDQVLHAKEIGRKLLNFEITWNILFLLCYFTFLGDFFIQFQVSGLGDPKIAWTKMNLSIAVWIAFYLMHIIFILLNALRSYRENGEVYYPALPILRKPDRPNIPSR